MQPFSPSARSMLVAAADKQALSLVVRQQAVASFVRPVGAVASFAAGSRHGARAAAFGKRWGRGVPASEPILKPSPNMAVKRDWPEAASVGCCSLATPSPSLPRVAASPLLLR